LRNLLWLHRALFPNMLHFLLHLLSARGYYAVHRIENYLASRRGDLEHAAQ
jgi:hypothetical protein